MPFGLKVQLMVLTLIGVPLPVSTQWQLIEEVSGAALDDERLSFWVTFNIHPEFQMHDILTEVHDGVYDGVYDDVSLSETELRIPNYMKNQLVTSRDCKYSV